MANEIKLYSDLNSKDEWIYVILSTVFLAGIYYDAWSHTHIPDLESFFTPSHGLMYSGALLLSGFILWRIYQNFELGLTLKNAIPRGYELSFYGIIIFIVAGVGDLIWHTLFGIEQVLEASFSPTHMGLMVGLILLLGGPFYAEWLYPKKRNSFFDYLPIILGATYLYSGFTVISQWAHPYVVIYAISSGEDVSLIQGVGILSIVIQTAFLMSLCLLILKRQMLPTGSFSLIFSLNAFLLSLMRDYYIFIISATLTGILADLYVFKFKPYGIKNDTLRAFRIFSLWVPGIMFTLYFLLIANFFPIVWSIHMTTGGVAVSMGVSYLISILIINPLQLSKI